MFLEDRLTEICEDFRHNDDTPTECIIKLLQACVDHISERVHGGMKVKDVAAVILQTDKIWRTFSAKKLPTAKDVFYENYIRPRIVDNTNANPALRELVINKESKH